MHQRSSDAQKTLVVAYRQLVDKHDRTDDCASLARLIALEGEAVAMPTAVLYNSEELSTYFDCNAIAQHMEGTEITFAQRREASDPERFVKVRA